MRENYKCFLHAHDIKTNENCSFQTTFSELSLQLFNRKWKKITIAMTQLEFFFAHQYKRVMGTSILDYNTLSHQLFNYNSDPAIYFTKNNVASLFYSSSFSLSHKRRCDIPSPQSVSNTHDGNPRLGAAAAVRYSR